MIHVDPSKVPTRRACNRCHQAKLKCVLDKSRKCQRCKRSNTECTFSPPTRIQRQQMRSRSPSSTSVNRSEHRLDSWPDVDFGWGDLAVESSQLAAVGFDTDIRADNDISTPALYPTLMDYSDNSRLMQNPAFYTADQVDLSTPMTLFGASASSTTTAPTGAATTSFPGYIGSEALGIPVDSFCTAGRHAITTSTNVSSEDSEMEAHDEHPTDLAFWADKITAIAVKLTQHLQSLPRVNHDSLHHDSGHGALPRPKQSHNPDRTFDLSESFINVLSGMCFKLSPQDASGITEEDCSTKYLILDEASYLLIFSTYLRFLEVHDTVFRYLLACLSHKREGSATGSCFYLPKLILGSVSLAMTSETRPLLFVNLMESMLGRAKSLFHHLASTKTISEREDNSGSFGSLSPILEPKSALQAVQAREASIIPLVERIKTTLAQPKSFKR
jgi:hypothetical protein